MAAIDKIRFKEYYYYNQFKLWCLIYYPKLLCSFYDLNLTEKDWNKWKLNVYNHNKKS